MEHRITTTRRINTKGIIVLELGGNKPAIIRNANQFIQDGKNSFLLDDTVENINHPQVTKLLRQLRKGTVSGDITLCKKGDDWTVTEDSRVIKDSNHPQYGKVSVGDTMQFTADQMRVDGFLDLTLNSQAELNREKAEALASAEMAATGAFDFVNSSTNTSADESTDDLPDELINEVIDNSTQTQE